MTLANGIHVREFDVRETTAVELAAPGARIDRLLIGKGLVTTAGAGAVVEELVLEDHGELQLSDIGITAESVTGSDSVKLGSGSLHALGLTPTAITIRSGATLFVEGPVRHAVTLQLRGGTLVIDGSRSRMEDVTVEQSNGVVTVRRGGALGRASFREEPPYTRLEIESGQVLSASGRVSLDLKDGLLLGSEALGVGIVPSAPLSANSEIENLNFFLLTAADVSALGHARRITPWWPARVEAHTEARAWSPTPGSPQSHEVARAHYWGQVERLLRDKGARGHDLAVAHEIAQDTRRLAAKKKTAERRLLTVSMLLGYTARPMRPVWIWLVTATVVAVLVRLAGDGLCWCNFGSGFALWFDVLISPVTWVRQVGAETELVPLIDESICARVFAFVGRVIGTVALGTFALAIRRYVRPGQD